MPIPQVTDRIKEASAVVLRAVFAGIGQLLMAVDKIRAQNQEQHTAPAPAGQNGTGPADTPPAAAQADTTPARPAATKPAAQKPATAKPAAQKPSAAKRAAGAK